MTAKTSTNRDKVTMLRARLDRLEALQEAKVLLAQPAGFASSHRVTTDSLMRVAKFILTGKDDKGVSDAAQSTPAGEGR